MKLNINFSVIIFLFSWIVFVLFFQGNNPGFDKLGLLFLTIINGYFLGLCFIEFLTRKYQLKGTVISNVSIFFGLILMAPFLVFTKYIESGVVLFVLSFFNLCMLYAIRNSVTFRLDFKSTIPAIFATLLTIFGFANFQEMFSSVPILYKNGFKDYYFFTAVTSSIRDFDFSNTNYEKDSGIYYHVLGFFPAAAIAGFSKISSHVSLWSISMPIMIFSAYSSIHALLDQFLTHFPRKLVIIALVIFIFHFPLNPNCLFNGKFNQIVWVGAGHTLPVIPTWAAVYSVSILLFLVIGKITKITMVNFLVVVVLTLMLALAKVTAIFIFYPLYFLYILLSERKIFSSKIITMLVGLIPVFILIVFYYSNGSAKFVFEPGGYIISENLHTDVVSFNNFLNAVMISVLIIIIWIGLKFHLLIYADRKSIYFFLSLLFSLCVCVFLQSILRIKSFSDRGELLVDGSFDLLQFTRSVFVYFDFFAILLFAFLLKRFFKNENGTFRFFVFLTFTYTAFVVIMIFGNLPFYIHNSNIIKPKWGTEVIDDLKLYRNERKVIVSDNEYSGQFIAAHDIENFVFTIKNGTGGYTSTNKNYYLYKDFTGFIAGVNPDFKSYIKRERIKILIATPNTLKDFKNLESKREIKHIDNTNWLYSPVF